MTKIEYHNARQAQTAHYDESGAWYKLDNAAIIMPAVTNRRTTSLFRIAFELDHPVRVRELSAALEKLSLRFPYLAVELHQGFFWNYFQPLKHPLRMSLDSGYPCMDFDLRKKGSQLVRVRVVRNSIACEFSHVLTDGSGGLIFVKALLVEYFRLLGLNPTLTELDFDPDSEPDPEEYEDAYQRFYKPGTPIPKPLPKVYHLRSPLLPPNQYRVTVGEIALDELLAQARSHKASITEFLSGVYLESLLRIRAAQPAAALRCSKPYISLEMPVNMRKFFPTKTLRNFSLFILPTIDTRLGPWSLDELISYVRRYMAMEHDPRYISQQISRNAGGGRKLAVRLIPLFVKNFFARLLFVVLGEALISGLLSNLGAVSLPQEIQAHVKSLSLVGAPSRTLKTHASFLSWNDTLYVAFGSLATSRELERLFFSRLASLGMGVRVHSNMEA